MEIVVSTKLPRIKKISSENNDDLNFQPKYVINVKITLKKPKDLKCSYPIKYHPPCNQVNYICLITYKKCKLQYVGSTVNFKAR